MTTTIMMIAWHMWHAQVQYGCAIIQLLMSRLDEKKSTDTVVKTCIVGVLAEIVHITAEGSIGMNFTAHSAALKERSYHSSHII